MPYDCHLTTHLATLSSNKATTSRPSTDYLEKVGYLYLNCSENSYSSFASLFYRLATYLEVPLSHHSIPSFRLVFIHNALHQPSYHYDRTLYSTSNAQELTATERTMLLEKFTYMSFGMLKHQMGIQTIHHRVYDCGLTALDEEWH